MDSLMTFELKQGLEREFSINLASEELRAMSFQSLHALSDPGDERASLIVPKAAMDIRDIFYLKATLINDEDVRLNIVYRLISKSSATSFDERLLILPGVDGDTSLVWHLVCK